MLLALQTLMLLVSLGLLHSTLPYNALTTLQTVGTKPTSQCGIRLSLLSRHKAELRAAPSPLPGLLDLAACRDKS